MPSDSTSATHSPDPTSSQHGRADEHFVGLGALIDALAQAGVDSDRLYSSLGTGPVVIDANDGGWIELCPVMPATDRAGWAYTRHNARGQAVETGGSSATAPAELVRSLLPHLVALPLPAQEPLPDPADAERVQRLRARCGEHLLAPIDLYPADPAARWILTLAIAWKDLQTDGHGVSGADLVDVVDAALQRIGLGDDVSVADLARRIETGTSSGGGHPAVAVIAPLLDRQYRRQFGISWAARAVASAREITDALLLDGQLVTCPAPRTHRGEPATHPGGRPNNEDRAGWAAAALDVLAARAGDTAPRMHRDPELLSQRGVELVAALLHLTDRAGLDPDQVLAEGRARHRKHTRTDHDPSTCSIPGCLPCDRATAGPGPTRRQ